MGMGVKHVEGQGGKSGKQKVDGDRLVTHYLNLINTKLSSGASDLYIELFGIGINDWRVLTVVAMNPGCIAKFVAERMSVHKAVVSRSVQYLLEQGYVAVGPDAREKSIHLTRHGEALHNEVSKIALMREKLLLAGLTPEQLSTLKSLLAQLLENVPRVNSYRPARRNRA